MTKPGLSSHVSCFIPLVQQITNIGMPMGPGSMGGYGPPPFYGGPAFMPMPGTC